MMLKFVANAGSDDDGFKRTAPAPLPGEEGGGSLSSGMFPG